MGKKHHCEDKNCGKCARGPQGLPGCAGPTGPQGLDGKNGADGPQGLEGPTGPQGPPGQVTFAGPTGPQGPQGLVGQQGNNGQNGENGLNGNPGPQGPMGPMGPTGPPGPPGNAVQFLAGRGGGSEVATFTKVAANFSSVVLSKVGTYNLRFRVRSPDNLKMTLNKEFLANDSIYTVATAGGQVHIGDLIVKTTTVNSVFMIQGNANMEVENMIVISLN